MTLRRLLSVFCVLSITLWLMSVVTTGFSAATVFPVLLDLNPTIPEYAAFDADRHGRLLAGLILEPIFHMANVAQWFLAPLSVVLIIILSMVARPPKVLNYANLGSISIAFLLVLGRWFIIDPPMDSHLESYRAAARAGDMETALTEQAAFNRWHRFAEPMWGLAGLVLLVSLISVSASLPSDRRSER